MVERKVKVAIPCGIHIRPAGIISHTANSFKADSRIVFGYHVINTASIPVSYTHLTLPTNREV